MDHHYLDLSQVIANDIEEGRRLDPKNFMRRSRMQSARAVILEGWATLGEAQAMYNVEFTEDEVNEMLALKAEAQLEVH
jgi:hypothetical protein